jgi:hypothetical protein
MGDVNIDMHNKRDIITAQIYDLYGASNLISKPTCFKKTEGTLIDPVIVSNKGRFQSPINEHCRYSDYHNMVGCVTKMHMPPQKPIGVTYRSYKDYSEERFLEDVSKIPLHVTKIFDDVNDQSWMANELYKDVINKHASIKSRLITTKQVSYMNSTLRKQMYKCNMIKDNFFACRTQNNRDLFIYNRNKAISMRRLAIKAYFRRICEGDGSPRAFYNAMKPFITGKSKVHKNIILKENDTIISNRQHVCEILNSYFSTIADSIGLPDGIDVSQENYYQEVLSKHVNHPSVKAIRDMNI